MSRPIRISNHKKASKRKTPKERGYPIKDPHLVDYLQGFLDIPLMEEEFTVCLSLCGISLTSGQLIIELLG